MFSFFIFIRPSVLWDVSWRMVTVAYKLRLQPKITKASNTEQPKPEISHSTLYDELCYSQN